MATTRTARKASAKAMVIAPKNQNPEAHQNYDDRTVAQYLDPAQARTKTAFDRYLICGIFSEVQLVGFNDYGQPVYRCFTSPNLEDQVNITLTRKGRKVTATVETLYKDFEGMLAEQPESKRGAWKESRTVTVALEAGPYASDADLLRQAMIKATERQR